MIEQEIFRLQLFAEGASEGAAEAPASDMAESTETAEQQEVSDALPEQQEEAEISTRDHWQAVEQLYRQLEAQAEEVARLYPGFDLREEMQDARFGRMLSAGVDMAAAYQAIHAAEIIPAAMEYAARTVEQRLASTLGSTLDRPAENGLRSGGAVTVGGQVSRLSRQDYARICRMVERGERISFG